MSRTKNQGKNVGLYINILNEISIYEFKPIPFIFRLENVGDKPNHFKEDLSSNGYSTVLDKMTKSSNFPPFEPIMACTTGVPTLFSLTGFEGKTQRQVKKVIPYSGKRLISLHVFGLACYEVAMTTRKRKKRVIHYKQDAYALLREQQTLFSKIFFSSSMLQKTVKCWLGGFLLDNPFSHSPSNM